MRNFKQDIDLIINSFFLGGVDFLNYRGGNGLDGVVTIKRKAYQESIAINRVR